MREIGLLLLFLLITSILPGATDGEITLCDLGDHSSFEGKRLSIRGRLGFTMHGTAFLPEPCKNSPPGVAVLFPGNENSPKVEFTFDPQTLERLSLFFRPTGGSATACGVLTGKLFYKRDFRLRREGAGPQGNGYGPRGALRWGFVLEFVGEIHPCD